MGIHLADQTRVFFLSCLLGGALGMLYDLFRILRVAFPAGERMVFAQDVIYWGICAVASFLFLLTSIDGVVRVFLLAGELLGWTVYRCTLGVVVMRLAQAIIGAVRGVLSFAYRYLIHPIWRLIYGIVSLLTRPIRFLGEIIKKAVQRLRFNLKVRRIVLYNHYKGYLAKRARTKPLGGNAVEGKSRDAETQGP